MRSLAYPLAAVAAVGMLAAACQKPAPKAAAAAAAAPMAAANPVSDAIRAYEARAAKNLTASIDEFPAAKFRYAPTKAQMTVRHIAVHLSEGNDMFCSSLGDVTAPTRTALDTTASKADLVTRLKDTFAFCDSALAKMTDASLADSVPSFGGRKATRAMLAVITVTDWADHYSQLANYLRLNRLLPPTAQRQGAMRPRSGATRRKGGM